VTASPPTRSRLASQDRPAARATHHTTTETGTPALGIAGRMAAMFQSNAITPLLAIVALLLGLFAVLVTPREEEPQINVTMANVLMPLPRGEQRGRAEHGRPPRRSRR